MQYTTVLFDLDGTLTKSEEGITRTAIYAAEKMSNSRCSSARRCMIPSERSSA